MRRTEMRAIVAAALFAYSLQVLACGYCVEDKMAAVYDHAIVTRALAQKHQVAFFHIEGELAPWPATKRALEGLANDLPGADRGSARVSPESAALSVAFNPQRVSAAALQAALERKLAAGRKTLMLLQVMDRPADFSPSAARALQLR
jgi:hypothetical protein